jgi:hypothetical protein
MTSATHQQPALRILKCHRCDALALNFDVAQRVVRELPPNWQRSGTRRDGSPRIICDACASETRER